MANTLRDLSKWLNIPNLHPENMTALLVLLAQGDFVAEDILPVVPSSDDFTWLTEAQNDKFTVGRKRGERGLATKNDVYDTRLTGSAYEYFESADLTAKDMRANNIYSFVNMMTRKVDLIAGKIRMNVEKDMLATLQDDTTYTTINTHSCSTPFTTRATSDPIKDIELALNKIRLTEHVEGDTIILGGTDKTNLKLSDDIRATKMYTSDYTVDGIKVERINGLTLYTSTAVYLSGAVYVPILSGQGLILKKGIVGELREAQPYLADSEYTKKIKVLTLYGSRVIKPIVTRPKSLCILKNVS